mgnify:CR=1 FL=1
MIQRFFTFIVLCTLIPASIFSRDYLWPTDASPYLTSSFGEFRTRHFHAGLDIKTWNQNGYKAIAIEDGYVWRIRTSNRGYGKVVYVKLDDGHIAVYAHLDRFSDEIDEFVHSLHTENNNYDLDYFPKPSQFPVNKGDVVGYTGDTGTRHPHLHFEIRSPKNEPVNPLKLGLSIEDEVAPTPQAIAITPLEQNTLVDGNHFLDTYNLSYIGGNTFRSREVHTSGTFGIEIKAYDGVEGIYNKYSVYSAEIFLEDSSLFSFQYDQFSFSDSKFITIERNYALSRLGYGHYQRLYKTIHTDRLPFYPRNKNGHISLPPGSHTLRIELRDFNGNVSEIVVPVHVLEPMNWDVTWLQAGAETIRCQISSVDSAFIENLAFQTRRFYGDIQTLTPTAQEFAAGTWEFDFAMPQDSLDAYVLSVGDPGSTENFLFPFSLNKNVPKDFDIDWVFTELGMIARIDSEDPVRSAIFLETLSSDGDTSFSLYTHNLTEWNSKPIPAELLTDRAIYVTSAHNDVLKLFPNTHAIGGLNRNISLANRAGTVRLHMNYNSLYYPSLVWFNNQDPQSEDNLTPIYSFYPRTVPFRNPASVQMAVPDVEFPKRQLGIYFSEDKVHWSYLPSEFNADSTFLSGDILSLEAFTIRRDSIPPSIFLIRPKANQGYTAENLSKITYRIFDTESGIRNADSIKLLLNNEPVIFEFNPITKILTYRLRKPLESGNHSLSLAVEDASGNVTEESYNFVVR